MNIIRENGDEMNDTEEEITMVVKGMTTVGKAVEAATAVITKVGQALPRVAAGVVAVVTEILTVEAEVAVVEVTVNSHHTEVATGVAITEVAMDPVVTDLDTAVMEAVVMVLLVTEVMVVMAAGTISQTEVLRTQLATGVVLNMVPTITNLNSSSNNNGRRQIPVVGGADIITIITEVVETVMGEVDTRTRSVFLTNPCGILLVVDKTN